MAVKDTKIPRETRWPSVLYYLYLHFSALIGLYLAVFQAKWTTVFYSNYLVFTDALHIRIILYIYQLTFLIGKFQSFS